MELILRYKLILILTVIFFSSCIKNELIKYEYHDTGELKSKVIYKDKKDTTSFQAFLYHKNGQLSYQTTFIKGERVGKYYSYYENGGLKESFNYLGDKLHGVIKTYTNVGELKEESLYINGKHILLKEFFLNPKHKLFRTKCYKIVGNKLEEIGIIVYNNDKEVIEDASFFYDVFGKDTLKAGIEAECTIKFYNKRDDFNFELYVGELDSNLTFIDTTKAQRVVTKSDTINYSFIPFEPGNNLLIGMIFLKKDTIILDFPFYKEYYVRE